jgi:hypothetical protein
MAVLLVVPGVASAAGIISALSVSPSSVQGGGSAQGTVTLIPDVTPTTVLSFSSDPSVATVPASVVAPAGQGTVTFTIGTNAAAPATIVQITAAIQNVPHMANLSVNAATPPGPSLSSVSVTPSSLTGGSPATGTVAFNGVTNGATVQLSSSNPAVVQVPAETVVNGGAFAVTTSAVSTSTTAIRRFSSPRTTATIGRGLA